MAIHEELSAADYEAILERLTNECRQLGTLLAEAKKELYMEKEFDGLTLPGGIRALKKRYYDERDKVEKLTKELNKMMQDHLIRGRK
jgi:predicted RNase H-like nuclease (RuvC/YqgF family)